MNYYLNLIILEIRLILAHLIAVYIIETVEHLLDYLLNLAKTEFHLSVGQ